MHQFQNKIVMFRLLHIVIGLSHFQLISLHFRLNFLQIQVSLIILSKDIIFTIYLEKFMGWKIF